MINFQTTKGELKEGQYIPDSLAIVYVTLSVIIMAYSFYFTVVPILVFMAIWLFHAFYKRRFILRPSIDLFIILLLPALACYSSLWSEQPFKSIYGGAEFVVMALCMYISSKTVSSSAFIQGLSLGSFVVLVATLINGRYAVDSMSGTSALMGLFTSKNQVGLMGEIGIIASLFISFSDVTRVRKIFIAWLPLIVSTLCLYLSKSASSVASFIVVLAMLGGVTVLSRLPRNARFAALLFACFGALTLIVSVAAFSVDVQGAILGAFGKNSTLTGRTYLWSEGIRTALENPILGHGYLAFWVEGNPLAETLWREFFITGKTGFHFHSMYVQTFVDLGAVGLAVLIALILMSVMKSFIANYKVGLNAEIGILFAFAVMMLVRSFVEVDFLGPFGMGPFLFFSILPRLSEYNRRKALQA